MRHIIIGMGSIGRRHYENLKSILPDGDEIVTIDSDLSKGADLPNVGDELSDDDSVVYICLPTHAHAEHILFSLYFRPKAIFVEKPLVSMSHNGILDDIANTGVPVAVGYQYRFCDHIRDLKSMADDILHISVRAEDNLIDRYGPTALETMASHAIDYTLWINGPASKWNVRDEGREADIEIWHQNESTSLIHCDIGSSDRELEIRCLTKTALMRDNVPASNDMYLAEMKAWVNFLQTGERGDLCFLDDAMKVQEIMGGN